MSNGIDEPYWPPNEEYPEPPKPSTDPYGDPPPFEEPPPIGEVVNAPPQGSPLQRLGEAMADRKDPEWLVEGVFASGCFYILAGEPKMGNKTTLASHLSICLASGENFLGLETKRCRVAVLNLEDGKQTMLNRFWRFGIEVGSEIEIDLLIEEDRYEEAVEIIRKSKNPPDVLIIDPLLEVELLMGVQSENAAVEMGRVLKSLRSLARKCGICVILLHHAGAKSDMRGSSTLKGSTDGWITIKYKKKLKMRRMSWWTRIAPIGYVDFVVQYDDDDRITIDASGTPVFDSDGEDASDEVDEGSGINQEVYQKVCSVLQREDIRKNGISKVGIKKEAKIKASSVKPIIDILQADGLIEERGRKWFWVDSKASVSTPDTFFNTPQDDSNGTT